MLRSWLAASGVSMISSIHARQFASIASAIKVIRPAAMRVPQVKRFQPTSEDARRPPIKRAPATTAEVKRCAGSRGHYAFHQVQNAMAALRSLLLPCVSPLVPVIAAVAPSSPPPEQRNSCESTPPSIAASRANSRRSVRWQPASAIFPQTGTRFSSFNASSAIARAR